MTASTDDDPRGVRLRIFGFVALTLFGALFARLWYLQVLEREQLQLEALGNVVEPVFEQAPRGRILDRNGRVLVDNKVVQVVTVDPRELAAAMDAVDRRDMFLRLSVAVSRSGRLTKLAAIEEEIADDQYGPFDDIPVAVDVDPALLVFVGERPTDFPGVRVVEQTVRSYPYGTLAAHLLGYVGPITSGEWKAANARIDPTEENPKTYQLSDGIGKTGVEAIFEDQLRGVPGVRRYIVNDVSRIIDELPGRVPVPGNDVWLTVDIDLQALAERELERGLDRARDQDEEEELVEGAFNAAAGSVVAIDPRDGGVLAMASFPTYDPSDFVNGISDRLFDRLTSEENYSPILNRAIQGTYAPGSTFKLITSFAALDQGVIGPEGLMGVREGYLDTGTYVYPDCVEESATCEFASPYDGGGRSVTLRDAITVSSDTYFYRLGGQGFYARPQGEDEGIQEAARAFGLGSQTGVQLPYERGGVVPDRAYFDAQHDAGVFLRDGSEWFAGDTINLAIGQGDLLVTPTQLANAYATFANGGRVHQPNVAMRITTPDGVVDTEFGPRVLRELEIPASISGPILDGLGGVTRIGTIFNGTASRAFNDAEFGVAFPFDSFSVAGKTGTAERDGKADTSLFVAFGPADYPGIGLDIAGEPEIAIAVVMEESGFGNEAAAPVAAKILEPFATDTMPRARTLDETEQIAAAAEAAPADAAENGEGTQ